MAGRPKGPLLGKDEPPAEVRRNPDGTPDYGFKLEGPDAIKAFANSKHARLRLGRQMLEDIFAVYSDKEIGGRKFFERLARVRPDLFANLLIHFKLLPEDPTAPAGSEVIEDAPKLPLGFTEQLRLLLAMAIDRPYHPIAVGVAARVDGRDGSRVPDDAERAGNRLGMDGGQREDR
jgi:hypothetical protein